MSAGVCHLDLKDFYDNEEGSIDISMCVAMSLFIGSPLGLRACFHQENWQLIDSRDNQSQGNCVGSR